MREKSNPPITTTPIDTRLCDPAPKANAMGNAPSMVAMLVMRMGRNRIDDASMIASILDFPCSFSLLANSTIKIPFFVTNPISMMMPILEKIFSVRLKYHSEKNAHENASGTVSIMMMGSAKLSN